MNKTIENYLAKVNIEKDATIALIGSYATSTNTDLSDIDLIFVVKEEREAKIEIYENKYFVSTYYAKEELDRYFVDPELITIAKNTFRNLIIIKDDNNILKSIKKLAEEFKWSDNLRDISIQESKKVFISYLEEVQKSIQGLKDNHIGKMLNGVYGLSYGMFQVLRLKNQIEISSENMFYDDILEKLDEKDPVKDLAKYAFGITSTTIVEQVEAGLEMVMHIGNSMMPLFSLSEKKYVIKIIHEIIRTI